MSRFKIMKSRRDIIRNKGYDYRGRILLRTTDGGEHWQEIPDFKYQIKDMFFEDSLHGWAVGNDTSYTGNWPSGHGIILETFDGGDNWVAQVQGLSAPLNAIHFKDSAGWAVGSNGLILRTDNWVTWINQSTGEKYSSKYSLSQNYPNPFNPKTVISYQLPKSSDVELSIYNLLGQKVATLVNKKQAVGSYMVEWDASGFATGVYYYRIEASDFQQVKKMVLIK